jgi:DNA-directed RNA polymerase specialized sigma24 family protein
LFFRSWHSYSARKQNTPANKNMSGGFRALLVSKDEKMIHKMLLVAPLVALLLGMNSAGALLLEPVQPTQPERRCESPISAKEQESIKRALVSIDPNQAEDALQDALIIFLQKCRTGELKRDRAGWLYKGERIRSLTGWLHKVAKRKLLNIIRKQERQQKNEQEAVNSPSDELGLRTPKRSEVVLLDPALVKAVSEIPQRQLAALYERGVQGSTPAEMAERHGVPLTTINGRLRNGEKAAEKKVSLAFGPAPIGGYHSLFFLEEGRDAVWILLIVAMAASLGLVALLRESRNSGRAPAYSAGGGTSAHSAGTPVYSAAARASHYEAIGVVRQPVLIPCYRSAGSS